MATQAPDQKDPWAWNQWAQTQDPNLYGWKNQQEATAADLEILKPLLVKQGKWTPQLEAAMKAYKPAVEGRQTEQGAEGASAAANDVPLSSLGLDGYKRADARSSGYNHLQAVLGPDGQPVVGSVGSKENSGMKSGDWRQAATVVGGVLLAGYGAQALAGAGSGAAATGAAGTGAGASAGSAGLAEAIAGGAIQGGATGAGVGGAAAAGATGVGAGSVALADAGNSGTFTDAGANGGTNTLQNTLPESSAQVESLSTTGQASNPSLANVADASGTTVNAGNGSFQQFLQGGGQAKDYIQLGGLVASVAARPKAADTSGINDAARANAGIAERQQTLAEKQYADQLALFNEYKPMLTQQLQNTIAEQAKSTARSDQQWDDYTKTWLPIGQTLAQKSTDWASPGRMQQAAQEAQAGVATQYDTARQQSREQMIAAGLDPSTIATIQASTGALEAKDRAGAANTARRTVEQQGMAYLDNAARFGRNMTSTGLAAAGLAGQQGSQATNNYASLANASAAPAASANPLFNSAVGSNSSAGGLYGNAANINNQQSLQNYNQMMGTIAGVNQWYQSSKKTKKVHGKVKGAAAAVEKSGASRWSYKEGMGDGSTKERMGPMAEDLSRVAPSVSNGKVVDAIAMSGLHHAAIGENTRALREQNKRLKRIEKNLSLADA